MLLLHLKYTKREYDTIDSNYKGKITMKIRRRKFLILGSLLGLTPYLKAKGVTKFERAFGHVAPTIKAVQEHMFPPKSKLPSAKAMHSSQFLFDTMMHTSFDKDIKVFVLEGAEEFIKREKKAFITMTVTEKENALRAYEETRYGRFWLSRIMTLTMEGLFCDPIYGSNIDKAGWESLGQKGGFPRPKTKYLES